MRNLRLDGIERGKPVSIVVNGKKTRAYSGETVHAVLLACGHRQLRQSRCGSRGIFCGMGVCYECLVTINGVPNQRACMNRVEEGMEIVTDAT